MAREQAWWYEKKLNKWQRSILARRWEKEKQRKEKRLCSWERERKDFFEDRCFRIEKVGEKRKKKEISFEERIKGLEV